ncbi:hypothetical protein [Blastococcus brunescens]|uniref:Uncharacterized protein n=1 Tax=Blastococcus brunescens TaxID=1564165 RepID=A0ABZ1AYJ3_9ACTN|nr:hypothetical protein [Blastococcus sp. BMG 8361]WRL63539.1 hypothetical protein U6N30_28180 [Blastococcus sp. BMG 8361]
MPDRLVRLVRTSGAGDHRSVNDWLTRAPRWQLGLVMGLCCGLGTGFGIAVIAGDGWADAVPGLVGAGVGGFIVGATLLHGQIRRRTEAVAGLPAADRRAAERAFLRGPVPEDPETRAAAYALTQNALAEQRRRRVVGVVGSLVIVAMLVNLAVQASPWWWVGVAATLGLLVYGWFVLPRRLRRRADLLRP